MVAFCISARRGKKEPNPKRIPKDSGQLTRSLKRELPMCESLPHAVVWLGPGQKQPYGRYHISYGKVFPGFCLKCERSVLCLRRRCPDVYCTSFDWKFWIVAVSQQCCFNTSPSSTTNLKSNLRHRLPLWLLHDKLKHSIHHNH